jgi:inorganic pyrophosphatase
MDTVNVIVEIPRDSRNKYEYDHETNSIKLDRHLIVARAIPRNMDSFPTHSAATATPSTHSS